MLHNLSTAQLALNAAVKNMGGQQAAIDACDRMYSAMFRSEPFPLKTIENWQEDIPALYAEYARETFIRESQATLPIRPKADCDHELDCFYMALEQFDEDACDYMQEHYPDFTVNGETLVVETCNYKGEGEGEGIALCQSAQHYPVFSSKQSSFAQVNS